VITCRTCRWWDQKFPANTDLGTCTRMGLLGYKDRMWAINMPTYPGTGPATNDVNEVRTLHNFGCVEHTAHGTSVPTLLHPGVLSEPMR